MKLLNELPQGWKWLENCPTRTINGKTYKLCFNGKSMFSKDYEYAGVLLYEND